jgi:hypothetical protein
MGHHYFVAASWNPGMAHRPRDRVDLVALIRFLRPALSDPEGVAFEYEVLE